MLSFNTSEAISDSAIFYKFLFFIFFAALLYRYGIEFTPFFKSFFRISCAKGLLATDFATSDKPLLLSLLPLRHAAPLAAPFLPALATALATPGNLITGGALTAAAGFARAGGRLPPVGLLPCAG